MSEKAMSQADQEALMVAIQPRDEENQQPRAVPLELFPVRPKVPNNDLPALITDFFDWLETAWQLPLLTSDMVRPPLPSPLTLTDGLYTIADLMRLCGYSFDTINWNLKQLGIFPAESVYLPGTKRQCKAYRKQDLAPFLEQW